jgi:hypothetical protein
MSIRYVPITDTLSLVHHQVKAKESKPVEVRKQTNHIWIYDRSGSMSHLLHELTTQLITLSRGLPKGDTLTLGWFSGEGQFNFIIKGFKLSDSSDYAVLEKAIRANSTPVGLTCFSEILGNTDQVIADLSAISDTFSLHFFTDGYPVVSNLDREIKAIYNAIDRISGKLVAAMMVGYGPYYNKELMGEMASRLGAMLVHSSVIEEYGANILRLTKMVETSEKKLKIESLVKDPVACFQVTESGVCLNKVDPDTGVIMVAPQNGEVSLFYISTEKPNKKTWDKVLPTDINFGDTADILGSAMYGAALVLTQMTKTDQALELLGRIGDKALVDGATNAYTIEEYGRVETDISAAIVDVAKRFSTGRDTNYLPPVNAFCVFDLLKILVEDPKAVFYPYSDKVSYNRIGVSSHVKEGYSKFEVDKSSAAPFSTLVWHSSHLNLSVLTRVNGTVKLLPRNGMTAATLGFQEQYPTWAFRNFTFLKDGRVNLQKFYVSTGEEAYKTFKNKGLVFEDDFAKSGTYGINIEKVPAINRSIAMGRTSATELARLCLREQALKAKVKALKYLLKAEDEEVASATAFTDIQQQFLTENGINVEKGGCYNAPMEAGEAKDQYMAKTFDIKIKGLMSLPTVKKVQEKIAAAKKLTPVEELVNEGLKMADAKPTAWVGDALCDLTREMRQIRSEIQQTKFAVLVGKKWFDEFTDRSQTELTVDGQTFQFEVGEEAVEI